MLITEILQRKGSSVVTVEPDATVNDVVALLSEHKIGAVVVARGTATVGIVSERDVVRRLADIGADVLALSASEVMSTSVVTCRPEDSIDDIAGLMTDRRIRHLPVLSNGSLIGIVTIGDVVAARIRDLEQTRGQLESYITQG